MVFSTGLRIEVIIYGKFGCNNFNISNPINYGML